jgi:hypothetical protein
MDASDVPFISIIRIRSPASGFILRTSEHAMTIYNIFLTHRSEFQGRLRYDVKVRTVSGEGKLIFLTACRAKCSVTSSAIQTLHKPLRGFLAADVRITADLYATLSAHTTVSTNCLKHFISLNL